MERFTWQQMKQYWELHSARWSGLDYQRDPDGLGNVCYVNAPLWLNEYYARYQRMTYEYLLGMIIEPATIGTSRALDVGCGVGRWCRFIRDRGYETVGIDLQRDLIEVNRERYPGVEFACISIQDYHNKELFDLISSVTVIQHIPFEEQEIVIHKMRRLLKTGGYAIVLENVRDQMPHVFSRSISGWRMTFENAGFSTVAIRRYDYSPFLRTLRFMSSSLLKSVPIVGRARDKAGLTPEAWIASTKRANGLSRFVRNIYVSWQGLAMEIDDIIEPILIHSNTRFPTSHCGFLFKAI